MYATIATTDTTVTTVTAGTLAVNQPLLSGTRVTIGNGANLAANGGLTVAGTGFLPMTVDISDVLWSWV